MSILLWSKMPSAWVSKEVLKENFSSRKNISTDIAAMKLYICLCLYGETIKRKVTYSLPSYLNIGNVENPIKFKYVDSFEAQVSYDTFTSVCSLSRTLVSRGLKKLEYHKIIRVNGERKKTYIIGSEWGNAWCKLPKKDLLDSSNEIALFKAFHNRYEHERDALKIFIYLLSVRTNRKNYIDVSRGVISHRTGISLDDIDSAVGFLQSVRLLEKVESKGYLKVIKNRALLSEAEARLHRYRVIGHKVLNYRTVFEESRDY